MEVPLQPSLDIIYFRDMNDGDTDATDIWVTNAGRKTLNIKYDLPFNSNFSIDTKGTKKTPAGLQSKAQITCKHTGNDIIKDELRITCEVQTLIIPIYSIPPSPRILTEQSKIDIGHTGCGSQLKFTFKLTNIGTKEGKFQLHTDYPDVMFSPDSGTIVPNVSYEVQGICKPTQQGDINFKIEIERDGIYVDENPIIQVVGQSLPNNVTLVYDNKPISELDFSKMFFGQKRVIEAQIKNESPYKRSYVVHPMRNLQSTNESARDQYFKAIPCEGLLNPYDKAIIHFVFIPPTPDKNMEEESYKQYTCAEIVETGQKIDLTMIGIATLPKIYLERVDFSFPKTIIGNKSAVPMLIRNNSSLPITYLIKPIAHFRFDPAQGSIAANGSKEVNLIFYPKSYGNFEVSTSIAFCDGIQTNRLNFTGRCVPQQEGEDTPAVKPIKDDPFIEPQRLERERKEKRAKARKALKANNLYGEVIDDAAIDAYLEQQEDEKQYALEAPMPSMPRRGANLTIPNPEKFGIATKADEDRLGERRPFEIDEEIVVKKKYKSKPRSGTEASDCAKKLTPGQQLQIQASHELLNFNTVPIYGRAVKTFGVINGLSHPILVALQIPSQCEFGESWPQAQVIPPRCTGYFDMVFTPKEAKSFARAVTWTVNGSHEYNLNLSGIAEPIDVQLNRSIIEFRFGADAILPQIKEYVTLTNMSQAEAEYEIIGTSKHFQAVVPSGTIAPLKSVSAELVYTPGTKSHEETTFTVEIKGGQSRKLKCIGDVGNPKFAISKKILDFGLIAVGFTKTMKINLKNNGDDDGIFVVKSSSRELTVSPSNGRVGARDSFSLQISIKATYARAFDFPVDVSIAGCQPIQFQVTGQAELPEVHLDTKGFEFGRVFVGSSSAIDAKIQNTGKIPAYLILDLSLRKDFRIEVAPSLQKNIENQNSVTLIADRVFITEGIESMSPSDYTPAPVKPDKKDDGLVYKLAVMPNTFLNFKLVFQPHEVNDFNFEFPLSLMNVQTPASFRLQPIVSGEAIISPITLSVMDLSFGIAPIYDPTNHNARKSVQSFQLSNQEKTSIGWKIDLPDDGIFTASKTSGELPPGDSVNIMIFFAPAEAIPYSTYAQIYARTERNESLLVSKCQLIGVGSSSYFKVVPNNIVLPIVPIGQKVQAELTLENTGFVQGILKTQNSADEAAFPVKVTFPEGNQLLRTNAKLPIHVSYQSTRPASFSVSVAITDENGRATSFTVTVTTDSSVFTLYPQIAGFDPFATFGSIDNFSNIDITKFKSPLPPSMRGFIVRYLNATVLTRKISNFPTDLINANGAPIFEIMFNIGILKKVEDYSSLTQINAAKLLLNTIRGYGGLLGSIKPEYLLPKSEFITAMKDKIVKRFLGLEYVNAPSMDSFDEETMSELTSSPLFSNTVMSQLRALESIYDFLSYESWMAIVMQVLKLFVIGRIEDAKFNSVPGIIDAFKSLKGKADDISKTLKAIPCKAPHEISLLKYFTLYKVLENPADNTPIKGFDGLSDCLGFLSAIKNTAGPSAIQLTHNASDYSSIENNSVALCEAFKELRLSFSPRPDEITSKCQVLNALIASYLFETLPHYIPSGEIEFSVALHKQSTKSVSISNPSNVEIIYSAKVEGLKAFTLISDNITVGPGSSAEVAVSFQATTLQGSAARLYLIPSRPRAISRIADAPGKTEQRAPMSLSPIVINLIGNVTIGSSDNTYTATTTLYTPTEIELTIPNPGVACTQKLLLWWERTEDENNHQIGSKKSIQQIVNSLLQGGSTTTCSGKKNHEAFATDVKSIKFEKDKKPAQISVGFIPVHLGKYRCVVVASGNGESIHEITASSTIPNPVEVNCHKLKIESGKRTSMIVPLDSVNMQLIKAMAYSEQRLIIPPNDKDFQDAFSKYARELEANQRQISTTFKVSVSLPQFFEAPTSYTLMSGSMTQKTDSSKRSGDDSKSLSIQFKPTKPGEYPCTLALMGGNDIRILKLKGICTPATREASIEFKTTIGKPTKQNIPFPNPSQDVWQFKCTIDGDRSFTCSPRFSVKGGQTGEAQVYFNPVQVGEYNAVLTVVNTTRESTIIYKLVAIVEEPFAEEKIIIECQARKPFTYILKVKPTTQNPGVYQITSTVPLLSHPDSVVLEGEEVEIPLTISAPRSGITAGALTLKPANSTFYIWYVVEVHVSPPSFEQTIEISTEAGKAVDVKLPITNPGTGTSKFDVQFNDPELSGFKTLEIPPGQTVDYRLRVCPYKEMKKTSSIHFYSDIDGEFWYKLEIEATKRPKISLAPLTTPIGKSESTSIIIDNPLHNQTINIRPTVNGSPSFRVNAKSVIQIPPGEKKRIEIIFTPCSVGKRESADIAFVSEVIGEIVYSVSGTGKPPQPMSPTIVTCVVGQMTSALVLFKNPVTIPSKFNVSVAEDNPIFSFLGKKRQYQLHYASDEIQVPFTFTPKSSGQFKTSVVITMMQGEEVVSRWVYPIVGNGITKNASETKEIKTKSHEVATQEMVFTLIGENEPLGLDEYRVFVEFEKEYEFAQTMIDVKPKDVVELEGNTEITVVARFSPLRPIRTTAKLIVKNKLDQMWAFKLSLIAEVGKAVGTITIESLLNKTSIADVPAPTSFRTSTPYHCYLAAGSATELAVINEYGTIGPIAEGEQTSIQVSFSPKMYGKSQKGLLVIDTLDSQYIYNVNGQTPEYVPPIVSHGSIKTSSDNLLGSGRARITKPNVLSRIKKGNN